MVTKTKLSLFVFVVAVLFVGAGLVGPRSAKAAKQDSEPIVIATADAPDNPIAATPAVAPEATPGSDPIIFDAEQFEQAPARARTRDFEQALASEVAVLMGGLETTQDEATGAGTRATSAQLLKVRFDDHIIALHFSEELSQWSESALADLVHQLDLAADKAFANSDMERPYLTEYHLFVNGEPLELPISSQADSPPQTSAERSSTGIAGKRIVLNPGHGRYESGGSWLFQRGFWWGGVEDLVNTDFVIKLRDSMASSGADLRPTRQLNKAAGAHSSGYAWWEMDASEYVRSLGAPESVWRPFGMIGIDRDIRSRPEYAKWIDGDVVISIHNNGGQGTGTETWYDYSNGHQADSQRLAQLVQGKIIQRLRAEWDPNWVSRGVKGSSNYGENRWFDGPAVIVEVGFMDTQSDNSAIRDPRFQSIVAVAIKDALAEFYGGSSVACPTGQFRTEYYNNRSLSGSPTFTQCESRVNRDWGNGGPGNGVGNDNFSVRWTGRFDLSGGSYTFSARADDGVKVWIDGALIIDGWRDQPPTTYQVTRSLSSGSHEIKVEYYENGGGAVAQLNWQKLSSGPTSCPTGQYLAQYYNNRGLSGTPVFTRCESRIDNNWGSSGPGNGVGNDNFSVRWTGRKEFSSGSYRFSARADDGVRVYVDGTRIIDAWRDQGATVYESTRSLSSGTHEIKMEYYENGGGAVAQLGWQKLTTTTCNNQYKAEYWSNTGLSGSPALTRCEGWPISHDWGGGSPGSGVPNDNFSARWTGTAHIDQGTYRFIARADDGIRVWLDNQLIINAWRDQGPTTYTVDRTVSSGNHTIKVEYYERGGGAVAQFRWERVSTSSGNLALNRSAAAWSQESDTYSPRKANDGSNSTRWSSRISSTLGTQRWYVDLGSAQRVSRVRINWETAYAARYWVIWSNDAQTWYYSPNHTDFYRNSPGWADHSFPYITARYVGLNMLTRAPRMNNYSLFEFEAYAPSGRSTVEMVEAVELQLEEASPAENIIFEE